VLAFTVAVDDRQLALAGPTETAEAPQHNIRRRSSLGLSENDSTSRPSASV
jgi:hypothetical protein